MDEVAPDQDIDALTRFVANARRLFVLTGAGCSTASGIPDYRDFDGAWKRAQPMTLQAFVGAADARRRYWARSLVGWPVMADAQPNAAHLALASMQTNGRLSALVTQNVDGLHTKAGAAGVIDLHGRLDTVVCLQCATRSARADFQQRLADLNPDWQHRSAELAPDGDADLDETDFSGFRVPGCDGCSGVIKPDVVFFGENVPRERVDAAMQALAGSDAMLIVGSSLTVFSGFRFAREAARLGLPIASLTLGRGRADDLLALHVMRPCDQVLAMLARALPVPSLERMR
ncbi:MAG: NAD-dependent protein deacetylase [Burkholderiaceae bacterium]